MIVLKSIKTKYKSVGLTAHEELLTVALCSYYVGSAFTLAIGECILCKYSQLLFVLKVTFPTLLKYETTQIMCMLKSIAL